MQNLNTQDLSSLKVPQLISAPSSRIWILSDIQQDLPDRARAVMTAAVDDIQKLQLDLDAVWCLGDVARGHELADLEAVADIFVSQVSRLQLPVAFLLGNHDMDLKRFGNIEMLDHPLVRKIQAEQDWHMIEQIDDFYFAQQYGNCRVVFLGDHADPQGHWFTTHGGVSGEAPETYPYDADALGRLRDAIASFEGPVIIAAHYALPGGQKPSPLLGKLLPLPENVVTVLHGHAHIGDLVWNKDNPWQRWNPIQDSRRLQINVSALESFRSPGSHSAVLELDSEGPTHLRIRCHESRQWVDACSFD